MKYRSSLIPRQLAYLGIAVTLFMTQRPMYAAELFWRIDGTSGTLTSSNWSTTGSAPFTSAWVNSSDITFNATSAITNVTNTPVGNITVADNATVTWTAAGTFTTGGTISTVTVGNNATLTFNSQGVSTAAGTGFIKNGAGTWDIGAQANSYSGGFTINAGTVIVSGNNSFGTGALNVNGGTLQSTGTRSFAATSLNVGGNFAFAGTGNATYGMATTLGAATRTITNNTTSGSRILSGLISGGAGVGLTFTGSGAGQIYIGNASNSFTGTITINGGEVGFASDGALGNSANAIVIDGGRLTSATTAGNAVTSTWSSTHDIQVGDTAGTSISVQSAAGDLTYNGVISNAPSKTGAWAKQGGGILRLGGESTYTGATAINNGILQLTTGNNRLPTGTTLSLGQAASANVGTLDLNGFNQQIAGLSSTAGTNATANLNTITSATAATLTVNQAANTTYSDGTAANSGRITGAISLVKQGSGTLTLGDNTNNTYTGKTTVSGGYLAIGGEATLGANPGAFTADQITLNGGGIASTSGVTFSSNRGITLGASGGTFDTTGGTITLTNVVSGTAGGALTKIGTGNLVLDGAHTYNGATTINNGTLTLASGGSLGSGNISVGASGTLAVTATSLDLAGARLITNNGTVMGTVNINSGATAKGSGTYGSLAINSGGTISPGNSPGLMTMSDLTINGGNYLWELGALSTSNPGTDFDQVQVNSGNATLTGGTVTLDFNTLASGLRPDAGSPDPFWNSIHQWTILTVTGGGSLSGTFGSLVNGTFGVGTFSLGYISGGNGSVQLNYAPGMAAVPEPSSLLLAGVAAIPLAWYRRRRKAALAAAQATGDPS